MNRPSFQFYPGDWLGNSNLRRCTHAEKGVWLDVLCLMHDSEEYGLLRWPLDQIAQAVGCQVEHLHSLIDKGVMKGADAGQQCGPFIYVPRSGRRDGEPVTLIPQQLGPIWYSSRMVRDEYVVKHRGGATRFGSPTRSIGEWNGAHHSGHPALTQKSPKSVAVADAQSETALSSKESCKSSPTGRVGELNGEPIGDGSSSSTSSSIEEREPQAAPAPPCKPKREKSPELTFTAWMERIKAAGEKPISGAPVWSYAANIGLPDEFVSLAWFKFKNRYQADANYTKKKYADWRQTFLNAVEGNWFELWYCNKEGLFQLTTTGEQARRKLDATERSVQSQEVDAV